MMRNAMESSSSDPRTGPKYKPIFFRTEAQRQFQMCHKKVKFASEALAKGGGGAGRHVYKCPICHLWHQSSKKVNRHRR